MHSLTSFFLLSTVGLQYLDASTSQFLRGGLGLIFVALMKQHILKDRLVSFNDFLSAFFYWYYHLHLLFCLCIRSTNFIGLVFFGL